ncbi:hypothetical protein [Streptomyces sp. KLOTTS4A1]|uniref:hypothetical protein n=1 Tax=Streptomyces sp. KLOTTS4A1 TaxID=3390996 RepID=UPI0039F4E8EB
MSLPTAPLTQPTRTTGGLALTLTLPGVPASAAIARTAFTASLHRYGHDRFAGITALTVTELSAAAARVAPGAPFRLSLATTAHPTTLHIASIDSSPRRTHRDLWLLAAAVDDWDGTWTTTPTPPPHPSGTWVRLPR